MGDPVGRWSRGLQADRQYDDPASRAEPLFDASAVAFDLLLLGLIAIVLMVLWQRALRSEALADLGGSSHAGTRSSRMCHCASRRRSCATLHSPRPFLSASA